MPYPHYTDEEIAESLGVAAKQGKVDLLYPRYWWSAGRVFQAAYPCFGSDPKDEKELSELIMSGKLRNGNGEKFPLNWNSRHICRYIYDKETARKNVPADAEAQPDFLLYDEEKQCFIELNTKNFYSKGTSTLSEVGEINVGKELPAGADEKTAARTNTLKNRLLNDVVADAAAAITELVSDLQKRDSIFSSNSKEYTDFYNGLKALRNKLADANGQPRPFNSLDELSACFNDPENKVFDMAGNYLKTKMGQKDKLSDRQIDRMSMCRRFRSIRQAVNKSIEAAGQGNLTDCKYEIIKSTAAHKTVLALMKNAGSDAVSRAFRSDTVYTAQFNRTRDILAKSQNPYHMVEYMKNPQGAVDKMFTPKKIQKDLKYNNEKYLEAVNKLTAQGPNKSKIAAVCEFLMQRTHGMLEELKANDTLWHSDEQKQFRIGVENLHDRLVGLGANGSISKQRLNEAFNDVSKLAEAYQLHHIGDSAEKENMKAVHRLGVAAEIRICQEYFNNLDENNMNPADLFKRVKAHQDLMRELDAKHDRYVQKNNEQDFKTMTFVNSETKGYAEAEKEYVKAFNQLINGAGYGKVVDEKVEAQAESLQKENVTLIAMAVTKNQSLKAIKEEIAKGNIPDPTKTAAAPKADNVKEKAEVKELGGMEERLIH